MPAPSSAYIAEAITSVVGCSQRTICVLSDAYLQSGWCRFELQAALRETNSDRSHKIIVVVLDPNCLNKLDNETCALLAGASFTSIALPPTQLNQNQHQQSQQLVQLSDSCANNEQQLVATLLSGARASQQQQVTTHTTARTNNAQTNSHNNTASSRVHLLEYGERKFWPKLKALMPQPRTSSHTLTLTTKN